MPSNILTHSRLKDWRKCARLHKLKYIDGWRTTSKNENLVFGSLIHRALEAWWLTWQKLQLAGVSGASEAPFDAAMEALKAQPGYGEMDLYLRFRVEVLIEGYDRRWSPDLASGKIKVLHVEREGRSDLINPETTKPSRTWLLAFVVDVIVEIAGKVYILEHKTSGEDISAGSTYWQRLGMDHQLMMYLWGAETFGLRIEGSIYDVLAKPGQRPKQMPLLDDDGVKIVHDASGVRVRTKDGKKWRESGDTAAGYALQTRIETPAEYQGRIQEIVLGDLENHFVQREIVRSDVQLVEFLGDTWDSARMIRESELSGRAPKNPDACHLYGQECAFWNHCAFGMPLEGDPLFERVENVHPELKGVSE